MADKIDRIIELLHDRTGGAILIDRDAVDVDRPENWCAVELRNETANQWADGHPVDTVYSADVILCVSDRESSWTGMIQEALLAADAEFPITWSLAERVYLPEIDKIMWRWNVRIYSPMEIPEEE